MSNYYFSPTTCSFYPLVMMQQYIDAQSWPEDAVEVTDEQFLEYSQAAPENKVRGSVDGLPGWIDAPEPTKEESVAAAASQKDQLTADATQAITVWQTKLLMGRKLTDAETTSLNSWMDYIEEIELIDTSLAPDIIWPIRP